MRKPKSETFWLLLHVKNDKTAVSTRQNAKQICSVAGCTKSSQHKRRDAFVTFRIHDRIQTAAAKTRNPTVSRVAKEWHPFVLRSPSRNADTAAVLEARTDVGSLPHFYLPSHVKATCEETNAPRRAQSLICVLPSRAALGPASEAE